MGTIAATCFDPTHQDNLLARFSRFHKLIQMRLGGLDGESPHAQIMSQ
jgi:hypothetical protein